MLDCAPYSLIYLSGIHHWLALHNFASLGADPCNSLHAHAIHIYQGLRYPCLTSPTPVISDYCPMLSNFMVADAHKGPAPQITKLSLTPAATFTIRSQGCRVIQVGHWVNTWKCRLKHTCICIDQSVDQEARLRFGLTGFRNRCVRILRQSSDGLL